eukprot:CAMPEP_0183317644 /NCGR_PEP_ID=MMETSP0160_2-20130417/58522_1 /TAXON_ID=2839 ORGANISM="Odontella Sinensis, Strain Grunow 1884" /NCGR_SAMPLE_ID=MMETSP0160_2 /ASSEMBLY_ACC=CAM_ASM_000250 /LENGTH=110 /DNA_ID=CAMNT_0025483721 /DNA_START=72 /DNA_END=404 /DNA_ORIENTATION=+
MEAKRKNTHGSTRSSLGLCNKMEPTHSNAAFEDDEIRFLTSLDWDRWVEGSNDMEEKGKELRKEQQDGEKLYPEAASSLCLKKEKGISLAVLDGKMTPRGPARVFTSRSA